MSCDHLRTEPATDAYREGWDRVFGAKEQPEEAASEAEEATQDDTE